MNQINQQHELAVDFAIDKELGAIAITTPNIVYLFDYSDGYQLLTKIEVENIEKVMFCQYNIVVLVNLGDTSYIVSYQVDDGSELGSYELKTGGYKVILKSDKEYLYFACGIKIGKLNMPDMQPHYTVDTEHSDVIIDFDVSNKLLITT